MNRKLVISLVVLSLGLGSSTPVAAGTEYNSGGAMIADVVVARPLCFVATLVGTAFFVISLPFSVPTGGVARAKDALVVTPARATFARPLGDLDSLTD